ncbi:MAG: prephenate dehydrogenase [Fusobacteria bacterium]|nr:prephenate dehydrogenase [Fusobacteriota bacterium]
MKVGIVGLGLIGASIALSLKDKVDLVVGLDNDLEVLRIAKERKIIAYGGTDCQSVPSDVDIVILALYPKAIIKFIQDNKKYWNKNQLIIDVAGLKNEIVTTIQKELPGVEFLGTHPMAGREISGIKGAREELFLGSNFIITPTEKNTQESIAKVKELALLLGVKNIYEMTPVQHDQLIAYTSHLPHLMALALVSAYEEGSEQIVGRSFLDAVRVADINENLWTELFLANKKYVVTELDKLIAELVDFKKLIAEDNVLELTEKIREIKIIKERIKQ